MSLEQPRVLIIGSTIEHLVILEKTLSDLNASWVKASSAADAVGLIEISAFALVLIDILVPEKDELKSAEIIRQQKNSKYTPIVFLTPIPVNQKFNFKGYELAPVEYALKPLNPDILTSKLQVFFELHNLKTVIARHNEELKASNQKILNQQKLVVEEERFKILLQMADATAHELRQPLTALQGNIELIKLIENDPEELSQRLLSIEQAVWQIDGIIKKMQNIRRDDIKSYPGETSMINIDQDIHILAVEDSDQDFSTFVRLVADQEKLHLSRSQTISEALDMLLQDKYDVVLLDYMLPDGNGLDFLKRMELAALETPVIAITGQGDELVASQMIKAGAFDYLPKASLKGEYFLRSIASTLEKFHLRMEIEQASQKLAQMATVDQLTGLYNRRHMGEVLKRELGHAMRYGNDLACLLLDLDFFKEVNDNLGHGFGDFVLQQFGQRLKENMRGSDTCFRYGGEEFVVLLPQTDIKGARSMAEKLRKICENKPYVKGDSTVFVTVSIGITSLKQQQATRADDLLICADKALYKAKAEGRNRVSVYSEKAHFPHTHWDFKSIKNRLITTLEKSKKATVESLVLLIENMEGEKFKTHSHRTLEYLDLIGAKLSLPPEQIDMLKYSAIVHDCTRILLGQNLLNKKGPLEETEIARIKDQPYLMSELIEPLDFFAKERSVLLNHHENYDGSGYPKGLKAEQIPVGARILSIAHALVAMTSERAYRPMYAAEKVLSELVDNAGTQFDPLLVTNFLDVIKENSLLNIPHEVYVEAKKKLEASFSFSAIPKAIWLDE